MNVERHCVHRSVKMPKQRKLCVVVTCECGVSVKRGGISSHRKTLKHRERLVIQALCELSE